VIGTSFGSVVAQEMTRQLEARGIPPRVLVLVDGQATRSRPPRVRAVKRFAWSALHWRQQQRSGRGGLRPRVRRHQLASRRYAAKHRPGTTSAPTIIVTSAQIRARSGDQLLGWGPYVSDDVTTLDLDGRHLELIRQRTHEFAPQLDRLIARYDPVGVTRATDGRPLL
jgi:thioesterase domain-containing protein